MPAALSFEYGITSSLKCPQNWGLMCGVLVVHNFFVIAVYHLFPDWSSWPLLAHTFLVLVSPILTHHDYRVLAALVPLLALRRESAVEVLSSLLWVTSDLCQCHVALDLLKWEGFLFEAPMPSSCRVLSGSSWKALISGPQVFGFCEHTVLTIFSVSICRHHPLPPLMSVLSWIIMLAKYPLSTAASPTPATLVLLQVFLFPHCPLFPLLPWAALLTNWAPQNTIKFSYRINNWIK